MLSTDFDIDQQVLRAAAGFISALKYENIFDVGNPSHWTISCVYFLGQLCYYRLVIIYCQLSSQLLNSGFESFPQGLEHTTTAVLLRNNSGT